jgi:hypothetical protein
MFDIEIVEAESEMVLLFYLTRNDSHDIILKSVYDSHDTILNTIESNDSQVT